MRAKIKRSEVEFTLTLTADELIHLEAAVDAYREIEGGPESYLGHFQDRYDPALLESMHASLIDARVELL